MKQIIEAVSAAAGVRPRVAYGTVAAAIFGIAAVPLSMVFLPFGIASGIAAAGFGVAAATGCHTRLSIAKKALDKVESLSTDLEGVKRNVSITIMEECQDKVEATKRIQSGDHAQEHATISSSSRIKIEKSLNKMCSQFKVLKFIGMLT